MKKFKKYINIILICLIIICSDKTYSFAARNPYKDQGYTPAQGEARDDDGDGEVDVDEVVKYYNENITVAISIEELQRVVEAGKVDDLNDEAMSGAGNTYERTHVANLIDGNGEKLEWAQEFEQALENRNLNIVDESGGQTTYGPEPEKDNTEEEDDNNDNEGKSNTAGEAGTADEIMQKADNWISAGEQAYKDENSINKGLFESTVEQAYNLLLAIGFVVIVIVGVILAIQFMLASADQKAIIKQKMLPYLTGCCVIFGAFGIWGMVIRLFGDPSGVSEYGKIGNLGSVEDADMIKTLGNNIIGILQIAGSFIAIIMLIVLGIKYMIGSAEEKAEYKVTMKNYVVGALLLFGIVNFIGAVQTMALGIFG